MDFLSALGKEYENIILSDINIDVFDSCDDEEQEANALQALINCEFFQKGKAVVDIDGVSIADALNKFGDSLDERVLLVFHFFHDLDNENERSTLRSLRKAIGNKDGMSSHVGILIISDQKISGWALVPESNLGDRQVAFFEY